MNSFFATGCVTWVGQLQTMPNGGAVLELGFAVDKYPKDAPAIFTTLKLYQKYAEAMHKSVQKGQRFSVEGQLRLSQWEKDGVKHERAYFIVEEMKTLGKFAGIGEPSGESHAPAAPAAAPADGTSEDNLPF